ncbi:MAG TPA: radical SAM protein [Bacteroidales bacterium]|nr:radical SAM protein [Bacteroidales bacterium]
MNYKTAHQNKIVLVYPLATNYFQGLPYSLLFLERTLRDESLDVVIFDQKTIEEDEIIKYVTENQETILLVGFSVMLSVQLIYAHKIAEYIKKNYNIPTVFGGWFPTSYPEICIDESFVDFIILGPGEKPFSELVKKIQQHENDFEKINALGYKKNDNIHINKNIHWGNNFAYPQLDFSKINIQNYIERNGKTLQYIATRGCNCKCNFCSLSSAKGFYHETNSVEHVISDLTYFKKLAPQIDQIKFNDDNFFTNKDFVLRLSEELIKNELNITWLASAHIKQFLLLYSEEELRIIKQSGCVLIYFGAESGDNNVLQNINKNYKVTDIIKVTSLLKKHNIQTSYSFMIGFPPDPDKDTKKTLLLFMKLYRINHNLHTTINIYMPLNNNIYMDEAIKLGFKIPESYSEFENFVKNGANLPWIKDDIINILNYFGNFYFPVFKREYPVNINDKMKKTWRIFFIIFYPFVKIRFLLNIMQFPFDAVIGLKILSSIEKKKNITSERDLNNFMIGIKRNEK